MKKILFSLLAFSSIGSYAQIDRSVRPVPSTAPEINIKNSQTAKLSNGITLVLSENHKLPKATFQLVMGSSQRIEGSKAGVSSMMGSLIMSGTESRGKDILDKEIAFIGADLSASSTGITLSCLTKHQGVALNLMQDVLMHPTFPNEEFERIKKQNESGLISAKTDPNQMAGNVENKVNFPANPYGEVMDENSLASITRQDVLASFSQNFTPKGAFLVIVGDVTLKQAIELGERYFGAWKGTEVYKMDYPFIPAAKGNRVIFVNKPGAVQSVITLAFPFNMKPGSKDQIALNLVNSILGGGSFGSRLVQNLREDKAFTYGAYSSADVNREGSSFSASGSFRNSVTDSAIVELIAEFKRITEDYVTEDELNLAKSSMAGGFARSLESPSTVARFALNIIRNNLPADYYQTYLKNLAAVTKEDILQVAQKYMSSGYNIIVVGNEEVLKKIERFDTDGNIEKLDAFGNKVVEMVGSDITRDELIQKYVNAVTKTSTPKAYAKKMKKVKSIVTTTELEIQGQKLTSLNIFVSPGKEASRLSAGAMVFQSSYFDGTKGSEFNMQGGKKDLSAEDLTEKKKMAGFISEMKLKASGYKYDVKGIETINGKQYYVLFSEINGKQIFDYYDRTTFLKYKNVTIATKDGETQEVTTLMEDYKEVNGLMFPSKISIALPGMNLSGPSSVTINGKVEKDWFQ